MDRKQMKGMVNNQFHFTPKKTYSSKDYVPLTDRGDWDGKVIVLTPTRSIARPPHKGEDK